MSAETRARLLLELQRPLPGARAHAQAWPVDLPSRHLEGPDPLREAAVLLALLAAPGEGDRYLIPLIERPATMPDHPGQIAFPGGRVRSSESARECALRETQEEIGLDPGSVDVLGRLTPVPIPVSGHRVEVFVGFLTQRPRWTLDRREVKRLIEADPDVLAQEGPAQRLRRPMIDGATHEVPAYRVAGALVWGATALMLAEFLEIWRAVRG